jgi:hypothetical protein
MLVQTCLEYIVKALSEVKPTAYINIVGAWQVCKWEAKNEMQTEIIIQIKIAHH